MRKERIEILGIGRNSVTVMDLVEDCGYEIGNLYHYAPGREGEAYFDKRIAGCFEALLARPSLEGLNFALSMGDVHIRKRLFEAIRAKGGNLPALIHPTCTVSRRARIGSGVQILPGSVVQGGAEVGDDTVITVNSLVGHSAHVGAHCLISSNVMIGAYCSIGDFSRLCLSATVVSGKVSTVGEGCILGAGAVLLCDMPPGSVFVGTPARKIR